MLEGSGNITQEVPSLQSSGTIQPAAGLTGTLTGTLTTGDPAAGLPGGSPQLTELVADVPVDGATPPAEIARRPNGTFAPGQSGCPGARKGSGRNNFLKRLDQLLNETENAALLDEAINNEIRTDPGKFIRDIILPLLPKTIVNKIKQEEKRAIRISFSCDDIPVGDARGDYARRMLTTASNGNGHGGNGHTTPSNGTNGTNGHALPGGSPHIADTTHADEDPD